jgi:hypoxanthine-DNA glycosylase
MTRHPGLPPVTGPDIRVLVLGTFPSRASRAARQYYGFPRNAFWRVFEPWGVAREQPYAERCARLVRLGVGVWDVIASCETEGSLDKDIRAPEWNDVGAFADEHARLELVVFNGQKARAVFDRHASPARRVRLVTLPSTSPANTQAGKLEAWRAELAPLLPAVRAPGG